MRYKKGEREHRRHDAMRYRDRQEARDVYAVPSTSGFPLHKDGKKRLERVQEAESGAYFGKMETGHVSFSYSRTKSKQESDHHNFFKIRKWQLCSMKPEQETVQTPQIVAQR